MAIFDELKSVARTLQEANKIPQYEQILGVQEKLLEMQNTISDLETENKKLKDRLEIKESLKHENNTYWVIEGDKKDGPFCTCCWDVEHKLVRLHQNTSSGTLKCPNCKTVAKAGVAQVFKLIDHRRNSAI